MTELRKTDRQHLYGALEKAAARNPHGTSAKLFNEALVVDSDGLTYLVVGKAKTAKQPYGDVTYADPGLQSDGKKRYPLDTEEHIRAAWSYINQDKNKSAYSSADYTRVRNKIKAAMTKLGADVSKDMDGVACSRYEGDGGDCANCGMPESAHDD